MHTTYRQPSLSSSPFRIALSLVLQLALVVLLIFPTFSAPLLKSFYFIRTASDPSATVYGAFGSCNIGTGGKCTSFKVGWNGRNIFGPQWLISAMVTWIPAFGLSIITFIIAMPALFRYPVALGLWRISDLLTSLATGFSFGSTLALMIRAKSQLEAAGFRTSSYGAALWVGAAAVAVSILISLCGPPIIVREYFLAMPPNPQADGLGYEDPSRPRGFVTYEGVPNSWTPPEQLNGWHQNEHGNEHGHEQVQVQVPEQEQEQELEQGLEQKQSADKGGWFARFDRKKAALKRESEINEEEKRILEKDHRKEGASEDVV